MLTIPNIGERSQATATATPTPSACTIEERQDGTWMANLQVTDLHALHLVGETRRELDERIARIDGAMPALDQLTQQLARNDVAAATGALAALRPVAAELRTALVPAYLDDPSSTLTQTALGLACLAAGRTGEARFHLLRAVPGQDERFAIGSGLHGFRWHPEAPRALLITGVAMQIVGAVAESRAILALLRSELEYAPLRAACADFPPHVLWQRPDVLRHVRGVIQVGANVGDESRCWGKLGIPNLLAFEPVTTAFTALTESLRDHAPRGADWQAVQNAVADRCGTLAFWEGEQSGNSSFLELNPERSEFHQQNRHARQIEVATTTLDAFFTARPEALQNYNLLFMDVQGTEHLVIEGARRILRAIDFIVLELSETEIYSGSWTADRMEQLLAEHGFRKVADQANEWPEQRDAIYARADLLPSV